MYFEIDLFNLLSNTDNILIKKITSYQYNTRQYRNYAPLFKLPFLAIPYLPLLFYFMRKFFVIYTLRITRGDRLGHTHLVGRIRVAPALCTALFG